MREGIPGFKEEAYFSSYFDSPGKGIEVHSVVMPRRSDWDVF